MLSNLDKPRSFGRCLTAFESNFVPADIFRACLIVQTGAVLPRELSFLQSIDLFRGPSELCLKACRYF